MKNELFLTERETIYLLEVSKLQHKSQASDIKSKLKELYNPQHEIMICGKCGKEFNDVDIVIQSFRFGNIDVSPCCQSDAIFYKFDR